MLVGRGRAANKVWFLGLPPVGPKLHWSCSLGRLWSLRPLFSLLLAPDLLGPLLALLAVEFWDA